MSLAVVLLAAALAQPGPAGATRCLGTTVLVSGLRAADLEDDAVAELRRFARNPELLDHRIRLVVFAPYGFDRGTTSNITTTRQRGETVRAHLAAAGLDERRIRVLGLGEHADYPFPPGVEEAERAARSLPGRPHQFTTAASVTVELPAGSSIDCGRFARP